MQTNFTTWHDNIVEEYPEHLAGSDSWAGHIPFALWLMSALAPKTLVELGVFAGNSLFAFAQAARQKNIHSRMIGIDTWASDPHSGGYDGEHIYQQVCQQQSRYPDLVELKRTVFDAARPDFAEKSINLLHIDGYHTYEAVSHDFQTWHSAVAEPGVILFHDTAVHRDDFGVWRFWEEIQEKYGPANTMEFLHSNGLGVLFLGPETAYPARLQSLRQSYATDRAAVQAYFKALGGRIIERFAHQQTRRNYENELERLTMELDDVKGRLDTLTNSRSWRMTAPLRGMRRKIKL